MVYQMNEDETGVCTDGAEGVELVWRLGDQDEEPEPES